MARRVDIPKGKVFVGHDLIIAIPVVDEVTKLPVDLSGFTLQFTVRDTPEGTVRLDKTSGILTDNFNGTDDAALVPILAQETVVGGVVQFKGKKHYTLRRADTGSEIPLAYGDVWFEVIAGR
jgi:hypothetical protein